MEWALEELHGLVGGQLRGESGLRVSGVRGLKEAGPEHLSFVRNPKFCEAGHQSRAGALIVPRGDRWNRPVIEVENPDLAIIQVLTAVAHEQLQAAPGLHPTAAVSEDVELGEGVCIGAHVTVENGARIGARTWLAPGAVVGRRCRIGEDCRIYANVTLYHDVTIGDRVILHSGSVIGADGFGYVQHERTHVKIPHVGGVIIEDDVEIGGLCTIDRGMLDSTIVRQGVKIDDHCHIGHNCDIGELSLLAGAVKLSGSVSLGSGCILAGDAGVSDNIRIGAGARLGASTTVLRDVPAGGRVWGCPARDEKEILRITATLPHLPDMRRQLKTIWARLGLDDSTGE